MGDCRYCSEPAGLMRSQHAECREKHETATSKIPEFFAQWLDSPLPPARFRELTVDVARTHYIDEKTFREITIDGFGILIDRVLEDHILTDDESRKVTGLLKEFGLSANDLPRAVAEKFAKCALLRALEAGQLPDLGRWDQQTLQLGPDEKYVWAFNDAAYFTLRSQTAYIGATQGISVRLMKGVYYRVGSFKGEPIKTEYLSEEATGILIVTNRAVYLVSELKVVKIALKTIVAVQIYSDGISITRDAANAKPQIFKVDDPWFASNVIAKLNQLQ